MMRLNFKSFLDEFLNAARGATGGMTEAEANAFGQHLQILQSAPEPDLAAGRQRVIVEAARLRERRQDLNGLAKGTHPQFSLALVLIAFLLVVGPFAAIGLALNLGHSGRSIFGFFSTPTLAFTPMPATHTSEAIVDSPTPTSNPTPPKTEIKMTVFPIRMMEPTIMPEPTPRPMLTLTVPAEGQRAY